MKIEKLKDYKKSPSKSGYHEIKLPEKEKKTLQCKTSEDVQKNLQDSVLLDVYNCVHLLGDCNYKHISELISVTKKQAAGYLSELYRDGYIDRDPLVKPFKYFPKKGAEIPEQNLSLEPMNNHTDSDELAILKKKAEVLELELALLFKKIGVLEGN